MSFDELGDAEMPEVEYCLNQFDQKKDFKPQYKWAELKELKEKLIEYEKKYHGQRITQWLIDNSSSQLESLAGFLTCLLTLPTEEQSQSSH